jgi:hypothetical protein
MYKPRTRLAIKIHSKIVIINHLDQFILVPLCLLQILNTVLVTPAVEILGDVPTKVANELLFGQEVFDVLDTLDTALTVVRGVVDFVFLALFENTSLDVRGYLKVNPT